jgi:hypothetical protein
MREREFVLTWQASDNVTHVAEKMGMTREACSSKAHWLRKKGVPLKKMYSACGGTPAADYKALARLVK